MEEGGIGEGNQETRPQLQRRLRSQWLFHPLTPPVDAFSRMDGGAVYTPQRVREFVAWYGERKDRLLMGYTISFTRRWSGCSWHTCARKTITPNRTAAICSPGYSFQIVLMWRRVAGRQE